MHRLAALTCASVGLLGFIGCGWDYTPSDNVLPSAPIAETDSGEETPPETETGSETGGEEPFPATYRFNCVDIKSMGDADETVFQVITLQNTWASDISKFKLNILIDLLGEDPANDLGTVSVRSGVGPNAGNQCSQADTESAEYPVGFAEGSGAWVAGSGDQCAVPSTDPAAGTYTLSMNADERVFIYAEDDDGTTFNCSADGSGPDAIPIWALESTITISEDRSKMAGTLTGCVIKSEALKTCSCLSACGASEHPDCGGCPTGSIPLGLLLGGVGTTQHCSDLVGEEAFDIVLEFSASRLGDVPMTCG